MNETSQTRRDFLRTTGTFTFAPSLLLLGGCEERQQRDPWHFGSKMSFTARYLGEGPDRLLVPPGPVKFPMPVSTTPLIGRAGDQGEEIHLRQPRPEEADGVLAYSLAEIVHRLLLKEVGIEKPALYVLLLPVSSTGRFRVKVRLPRWPGCTIGIPTIDGKLDPTHALALVHFLAHESTESFMVYPDIGGGARLYGDRRNRWIGEGMANLVATHAINVSVREGLGIAERGYPKSIIEDHRKGRRSIRLEGWLPGHRGQGRYAAAEYLCHRWYRAARKRGYEQPIAEFAAWLRTVPGGPPHRQVLAWLEETSGLDIGLQAQDVPIREVILYHIKLWKDRGWDMPPEATPFADEGDTAVETP